METLSRYVILAGIALVILGVVLLGLARLNVPLGRLPGDIRVQGEHGSFYFPIVTSIIVSIVLTLLLNIILRLFRK